MLLENTKKGWIIIRIQRNSILSYLSAKLPKYVAELKILFFDNELLQSNFNCESCKNKMISVIKLYTLITKYTFLYTE